MAIQFINSHRQIKGSALLFFLSVTFCLPGFAITDFQTWLNVTDIGTFNNAQGKATPIKYWLEGQPRFGEDSTRLSQLLFRPGLGYLVTPTTSLWLGYSWIYTTQPLSSIVLHENRIWQQILWINTIKHITFSGRGRFEERFFSNDPVVQYRLRGLVKASIPFSVDSNFSLVGCNELFLKKNGFDQNRFLIGIGYKINNQISLETGYVNQFIKRIDTPNFIANILAIQFFLSF